MVSHKQISGSKEGFELAQDEIDVARQSVNRFDYGQPFGKRYVRRDLACIVDLWLRSRSGQQSRATGAPSFTTSLALTMWIVVSMSCP